MSSGRKILVNKRFNTVDNVNRCLKNLQREEWMYILHSCGGRRQVQRVKLWLLKHRELSGRPGPRCSCFTEPQWKGKGCLSETLDFFSNMETVKLSEGSFWNLRPFVCCLCVGVGFLQVLLLPPTVKIESESERLFVLLVTVSLLRWTGDLSGISCRPQ